MPLDIIVFYYLLCIIIVSVILYYIVVSTPEIAKPFCNYEGNQCYAKGSRTANTGSLHLGDIAESLTQSIMESTISGLHTL